MTFDWQAFFAKVASHTVTPQDAAKAYNAVDDALMASDDKRRHPERYSDSATAANTAQARTAPQRLPLQPAHPVWRSGLEASLPVGDR